MLCLPVEKGASMLANLLAPSCNLLEGRLCFIISGEFPQQPLSCHWLGDNSQLPKLHLLVCKRCWRLESVMEMRINHQWHENIACGILLEGYT